LNSGAWCGSTDFPPIIGDDKPFDPAPWLAFPAVVMFGANYFADRLPAGKTAWFVWDKRDGMESCDFADCELAWSNIPGAPRLYHHRWSGLLRDSEKGKGRRVHPHQKPIAVMEWLLGYVPADMTIVDPYMGSGATGIAAVRMGRPFIGAELSGDYFPIAQARINRASAAIPIDSEPDQMALFGGER
jgi:site-specific DNA-methyltransferase (adenine-specific)